MNIFIVVALLTIIILLLGAMCMIAALAARVKEGQRDG